MSRGTGWSVSTSRRRDGRGTGMEGRAMDCRREMAIKRIWHGWTAPENAEAYRTVLLENVLPGIEAKGIQGYRGIAVLQRDHETETEFIPIMTFDSVRSATDFQGED
jgi:hypothetical protein